MSSSPVFHGFFYTEREGRLVKLPLDPPQVAAMSRIGSVPLRPLTERDYHVGFCPLMLVHCAKGYAAWNDRVYWLVNFPKIGKDLRPSDDSGDGLHIVEMREGALRHRWVPETAKNADIIYDLTYTPWDWYLSGDGAEFEEPLTRRETRIMQSIIHWTDDVHERMSEKYPPEKHWWTYRANS